MPIRTATAADVSTLVDLMMRFYRESDFTLQRGPAGEAFEQLLADPVLGRIWIAEQQKKAVGYVVLTLGFSMEYGGRDGFVDDLFVASEFRGRGLGRQLLEILIRECEHRCLRALHLEVGRANHRARILYDSRGFRDNDRQLLTKKLGKAIHESVYEPETTETDPSKATGPALQERDHE